MPFHLLLGLGLLCFFAPHGHEFTHDQIFLFKALLPALHGLHLLVTQVLERVQRSIEILGQHVLIEAATGQSSARIAACKVCIGAARAIEVAAARYVKDTTPDCQIYGHAIETIVWEELRRSKGAKHGRRWGAWECGWSRGLEAEVDEDGEEGEEDEVDGRYWRCTLRRVSRRVWSSAEVHGELTHRLLVGCLKLSQRLA
jgi:hypothetical protein